VTEKTNPGAEEHMRVETENSVLHRGVSRQVEIYQ